MTAISVDDARTILESHDLIGAGVRADEARRQRHGTRTTFVRVLEAHVDGIPGSWPSGASAGELRIVGAPATLDAAIAAVGNAVAMAGGVPVTAYSLADLLELSGLSSGALRKFLVELKKAGLDAIAEAPIDRIPDPVAVLRAARDAGLAAPRLTVQELSADARIDLALLARDLQIAVGGIRAFAPLARAISVAQPSTGYDDIKQIAMARLIVDNIDSIQVDWALYGPKLAQVALTMGADDVDAVSPFDGDLGRRRSPLEEIRGNIRAAGLEPVERTARFDPRA